MCCYANLQVHQPAAADQQQPSPFRRLESWRDAPRELRQFTYLPDPGHPKVRYVFDLAEFQFRYVAGGKAPVATLTGLERVERGRKQLTDGQIAAVCRLAAERRTTLANNEHMFTGEETRRAAYNFLTTYACQLANTLAQRFHELVIDEAQDCSDTDVELQVETGPRQAGQAASCGADRLADGPRPRPAPQHLRRPGVRPGDLAVHQPAVARPDRRERLPGVRGAADPGCRAALDRGRHAMAETSLLPWGST